ncbi:MAG: hypothetical protein ACYS1A_20395 [Planctomycetota bacterium]|jgi:hypothetical protein
MAIEIGTGPSGKKDLMPAVILPGEGRRWPARILNIGIIVLALAVVLTIILFVWNNVILKDRFENIRAQIKSLEANQQTQEVQKFVLIQGQLSSLKNILADHIYSSKIFVWLESLTHRQVVLNSISINLIEGKMQINGTAASVDVLSQQVTLFENNDDVLKLSPPSIQFSPEGVNFSLSIDFDTKLVGK